MIIKRKGFSEIIIEDKNLKNSKKKIKTWKKNKKETMLAFIEKKEERKNYRKKERTKGK